MCDSVQPQGEIVHAPHAVLMQRRYEHPIEGKRPFTDLGSFEFRILMQGFSGNYDRLTRVEALLRAGAPVHVGDDITRRISFNNGWDKAFSRCVRAGWVIKCGVEYDKARKKRVPFYRRALNLPTNPVVLPFDTHLSILAFELLIASQTTNIMKGEMSEALPASRWREKIHATGISYKRVYTALQELVELGFFEVEETRPNQPNFFRFIGLAHVEIVKRNVRAALREIGRKQQAMRDLDSGEDSDMLSTPLPEVAPVDSPPPADSDQPKIQMELVMAPAPAALLARAMGTATTPEAVQKREPSATAEVLQAAKGVSPDDLEKLGSDEAVAKVVLGRFVQGVGKVKRYRPAIKSQHVETAKAILAWIRLNFDSPPEGSSVTSPLNDLAPSPERLFYDGTLSIFTAGFSGFEFDPGVFFTSIDHWARFAMGNLQKLKAGWEPTAKAKTMGLVAKSIQEAERWIGILAPSEVRKFKKPVMDGDEVLFYVDAEERVEVYS